MKTLSTLLLLALSFSLGACSDAKSDAVGTYEVDKSALETALIRLSKTEIPQWDAMPPAAQEKMTDTIKSQAAAAKMTLELKDDDSFTFVGAMNGQNIDSSGTWVMDGDTLTLTTTHENGKEKKKLVDGDTIMVTLKEGVIEMKPEKALDLTVFLKKS